MSPTSRICNSLVVDVLVMTLTNRLMCKVPKMKGEPLQIYLGVMAQPNRGSPDPVRMAHVTPPNLPRETATVELYASRSAFHYLREADQHHRRSFRCRLPRLCYSHSSGVRHLQDLAIKVATKARHATHEMIILLFEADSVAIIRTNRDFGQGLTTPCLEHYLPCRRRERSAISSQ
jgi:hypothetical protein